MKRSAVLDNTVTYIFISLENFRNHHHPSATCTTELEQLTWIMAYLGLNRTQRAIPDWFAEDSFKSFRDRLLWTSLTRAQQTFYHLEIDQIKVTNSILTYNREEGLREAMRQAANGISRQTILDDMGLEEEELRDLEKAMDLNEEELKELLEEDTLD
ncbi:hypothetical protein DFS34DRAFT_597973 [Phlyctochytrium arcticum]|nr:hypothetical protein DFS34DRAFT_597973 [Phlyctochytrium arcticum]